jgi:hypothetical protein
MGIDKAGMASHVGFGLEANLRLIFALLRLWLMPNLHRRLG